MNLDKYRYFRDRVTDAGYGHEIEWAETVKPPATPEDFAQEAIWVICCSGFKEQRARVTQERVNAALAEGRSATEVFPRSGKGRAIDSIWKNRQAAFDGLMALLEMNAEPETILDLISEWPYIGGPILRYHFAKNMGVDIAKPDRWLDRVADQAGEGVQELCERLAGESGDRIATVDLVIWRACNLGFWPSEAA